MIPLYVLILSIGTTAANQAECDRLKSTARVISQQLIEDARLSTLGLVEKYGYCGEEHATKTKDGYMLALHRVLPRKGCNGTIKVVLLQHGLIASSADWVMVGPGKGFAYLLSDACYDVWMGNSRGNTYSRKHVTLSPRNSKFWDFSWHEMGLYDLPATIDYILRETKSTNLSYIGHSQGTTEFFVFSSLRPEYKVKINAMFALAPIAFMGHSQSIMINVLAKFGGVLGGMARAFGMHELLPNDEFLSMIGGNLCSDDHPKIQDVCTNLISEITGYDKAQMNTTILPVNFGHTPAGSSTKQFLHYAQLLNSGEFNLYDYGLEKNMKLYGQETPPKYPLEEIETPIALWYGANDLLAHVKDVDALFEKLKNPMGKFLIPWEKWNHQDFVWGIDANKFVYEPIIKALDSL